MSTRIRDWPKQGKRSPCNDPSWTLNLEGLSNSEVKKVEVLRIALDRLMGPLPTRAQALPFLLIVVSRRTLDRRTFIGEMEVFVMMKLGNFPCGRPAGQRLLSLECQQ